MTQNGDPAVLSRYDQVLVTSKRMVDLGSKGWRSRVPPGVGDCAQVAEDLVQLLEPALPDVVRPLGEHSYYLRVRHLGHPLRSRGQADQAGATVGRIGHPLDVPGL